MLQILHHTPLVQKDLTSLTWNSLQHMKIDENSNSFRVETTSLKKTWLVVEVSMKLLLDRNFGWWCSFFLLSSFFETLNQEIKVFTCPINKYGLVKLQFFDNACWDHILQTSSIYGHRTQLTFKSTHGKEEFVLQPQIIINHIWNGYT